MIEQEPSKNGRFAKEHALNVLDLVGITGSDRAYTLALYSQSQNPRRNPTRIGEFVPSAFLSADQRSSFLKVVEYGSISGNAEYNTAAKNTQLTVHPMDAGAASSFLRLNYLENVWSFLGQKDEPRAATKATDLFLAHNERIPLFVPIIEAKLYRLLSQGGKYKHISVQEILSSQSRQAYQDILDGPVVFDRTSSKSGSKRTVREYFSAVSNISVLEPIIQTVLPTVDTGTGKLTTDRMAPGGHGQLARMHLDKLTTFPSPANGNYHISAFYNGDGPNNSISPEMVGFTAKEAGISIVTTTRQANDRKGGLVGLNAYTQSTQFYELAEAREARQVDLFLDTGLEDTAQTRAFGKDHQLGKQYFNTNMIIFNDVVVGEFLKKLRTQVGEERFTEIITPDLVANEKEINGRKFTQLESSLVAIVLKLNEVVTNDSNAQELWKSVAGDREFLRIINLEPEARDEYFTPIKYAWDFWMLAYSDHFKFDMGRAKVINNRPLHNVKVNDALVEDPYYMDMQHIVEAFGHASVINLDKLSIEGVKVLGENGSEKKIGGHVKLADSILQGELSITSAYDGVFDLNTPEARRQLGQEGQAPLFLEDIAITIDAAGNITLEKLIKQSAQPI